MKVDIIQQLNKLVQDISKDNQLNQIESKKIIVNILKNNIVKDLNKKDLNNLLEFIINNYYLNKDLNIYQINLKDYLVRIQIKIGYENKRFKR